MYQSFRNNVYFVTTFAFFSVSTHLISMSEFYSTPAGITFLKPSKLQTKMKKYISILMLAPVLGMVSCDRETTNTEMSEDNVQRIQYKSNQHKAESERSPEAQVDSASKETGDDDEPQDDKQHWKVPIDSVW